MACTKGGIEEAHAAMNPASKTPTEKPAKIEQRMRINTSSLAHKLKPILRWKEMKMEINGAWFVMVFALFLSITATVTNAADPDILSDFVTGSGNASFDGNFFTFRGFREIGNNNLTGQETAKVTKAAMAEFPGVTELGVSMAVLQFPAGGVNPPHTHPRASELLIVLYGTLEVGFVDTTGKLFTQTVEGGDLFIFPKGLLHFQLNKFDNDEAIAISAFGSANAGTVSFPSALFASGISDDVLVKSFKTDAHTIDILKQALNPKF